MKKSPLILKEIKSILQQSINNQIPIDSITITKQAMRDLATFFDERRGDEEVRSCYGIELRVMDE